MSDGSDASMFSLALDISMGVLASDSSRPYSERIEQYTQYLNTLLKLPANKKSGCELVKYKAIQAVASAISTLARSMVDSATPRVTDDSYS